MILETLSCATFLCDGLDGRKCRVNDIFLGGKKKSKTVHCAVLDQLW